MMRGIWAICVIACVALVGGYETNYDDYKLYDVFVQGPEQLAVIKKLGDDMPVEYLTDIGFAGHSYQLVIPPSSQAKFEETLHSHGFSFKILIADLQKAIKKRWNGIRNPVMEWTSYHSLQDIYNWMDGLVLRNPFILKPYVIGKSYEGRPIKAVKLSRRKGNRAVFVEANIHAIEWITSAAGTCFFNNLLHSKDPEVQRIGREYDWIFVPVLNPDGFEYTHNVTPFWRKNRRPNGFSNATEVCVGTDLNRNFDINWKVAGNLVDEPCDQLYGGPAPNSEPEVQNLQKFVNSFPDGYIRVYTTLHSYGNMVLLPYGHTIEEFPPNYEQMMNIARGFAEAARVKFDTEFLYGASGVVLNPVSGSAKDWAYSVKNIPFSATIELRDRGTYGFFLPPEQILDTCAELTDGYVGLLKAAEQEQIFN